MSLISLSNPGRVATLCGNWIREKSVTPTFFSLRPTAQLLARLRRGPKALLAVFAAVLLQVAPVPVSMAAESVLNLKSSAALILDEQTGEVLYGKNAGAIVPIASITKLMTAMVVLDANLDPEEHLTVTTDDVDFLRGSSSRLAVGVTLTRDEMLRLALMASENRAASALSRHYPGGREAFVHAMNLKAQLLGLHGTRYADGTGLSSTNVSTAEDLANLVRAAHRYAKISEYMLEFKDENGNVTHQKTLPYFTRLDAISLLFDKQASSQNLRAIYPGAYKPVITSTGLNLGNSNFFLSPSTLKRFSLTSQTLINYLTQIYN